MGSLEEVAKSWLVDPAWQKVFKHTIDVMVDYVSYLLVAIGTIALSVRLLTTLSTGDLACLLVGVENTTRAGSLLPYTDGGALGIIQYAQTQEVCIRRVYSYFMEYMPFIMLLQTLMLVVVEKFTFKIPRIAQKVERFYKNIVEESLFGKDPDVTEDITDPKTSTEAISRRRQRNEICVSLKRSSIIHHVYIGKNVVECILVLLCLAINITFGLEHNIQDVMCEVAVGAVTGVVDDDGVIHLQCKGKKQYFFMLILWVHVVLLGFHLIFSVCAIIWCWRFRAVTNLLNTIETMRKDWEPNILSSHEGEDFLFLFDLLAHSCGLESTLRVLTHSDKKFYNICRPKLVPIQLEEDKMKVSWQPADIERWLHSDNKGKTRKPRAIVIDSYEVTIFPAESVKNTQTIPVTGNPVVPSTGSLHTYQTWFYDLLGGRTEYVITIACMIGKSRMKGEKLVTTLVPYGPEKPKTGMQKSAKTDQVEIFWDPPKGEFTKYTLIVDKVNKTFADIGGSFRGTSIVALPNGEASGSFRSGSGKIQFEKGRQLENLSYKLTSYTILGLDPGELYKVELATKTGSVQTRQSISDVIMTKPRPPIGLMVVVESATSAVIHCTGPSDDGSHSCLKGIEMVLSTSADGEDVVKMALNKRSFTHSVNKLMPTSEYTVTVTSIAHYKSAAGDIPPKRLDSEPVTDHFVTPPEEVRNLHLDKATTNSLTIKWDPPNHILPVDAVLKYRIGITMLEKADEGHYDDDDSIDDDRYSREEIISGEKTNYTFSRLPNPEGTGRQYKVKMSVIVHLGKEGGGLVQSSDVSALFETLPLEPSNLGVDEDNASPTICWQPSQTDTVTKYRVLWRKSREGSEAREVEVTASQGLQKAVLEGLETSQEDCYEVNVCAVAEPSPGIFVNSKALSEKFVCLAEGNGQVKLAKYEKGP